MKRASTIVGLSGVAVLLLLATFLGGIVFGHMVDLPGLFRSVPEPRPAISGRVSEAVRILNRQSLNPASDTSMTAGAIQGVLDSLDDPYALYFDEEHFEAFTDHTDGDFGGIGVTVSEGEEGAFIVSVMEGTPAEEAGVKANDVFVAIDGVERERWTVDEVVRRVRGPEGSTVDVSMRREGVDDLISFTIERAQIEIPNVMSRLVDDDVGYLRLLTFNQKSASSLAEAIQELEDQGATSFVLDLRDNPGGLLNVSVDVASLFVPESVIVRVEERDRPAYEHRSSGRVLTEAPLVLLVNGNSASASEVLAGALQDYERATLLGTQTFGKGSVQTVEELSFGGGMKFTIAHYLTPEGRVIDGVGLTPDIVVEMDPMLQAEEETDTQLQRAIREAKSAAR